jgi:predicted NAD/FAD-dependent oxidoreductase
MGSPQLHAQLRRLRLSANWVLMAAFKGPVPVPGGMQGALVRGCEVLSWAGNNNAKLGLGSADTPQCWTLISTQRYGRNNKVPQESVPPEVAQRVTHELLAAFAAALGLAASELPPLVHTRAQLWGAALPLNSPCVPCLFDPVGRVGVCGDWVAGGGSMQAAALSGAALAEKIAVAGGRRPDALANLEMGLAAPLQTVAGEDIGQFPATRDGGGAGCATRQGGPGRAREGAVQLPATARQGGGGKRHPF